MHQRLIQIVDTLGSCKSYANVYFTWKVYPCVCHEKATMMIVRQCYNV